MVTLLQSNSIKDTGQKMQTDNTTLVGSVAAHRIRSE